MAVTVRYYAGARAAAGVAEETVDAAAGAELTVGDLRTVLERRHGPRLAAVLAASTLLRDGTALADGAAVLVADDVVEVLPPFAGG